MDLTIDRSKWLCAGSGGLLPGDIGLLLDPRNGKMCCLGIYLEALGIPAKNMGGSTASKVDWSYATPSRLFDVKYWSYATPTRLFDVKSIRTNGCEWLFDERNAYDSHAAKILMAINDKQREDTTREARVAEEFARHGVKVTFTGEYTK